MPFAPKACAPLTVAQFPRFPAVERAGQGGTTLFTLPAGYLPTEALAATLDISHRSVVWLRLGPEDRDPAALLTALIAAVAQHHPDAGKLTLDQMRRQPGPIFGWPALFTTLAHEVRAALGADGVLVLEDCHHLADSYHTLQLLSRHILAAQEPTTPCILLAERALPPPALPAGITYCAVGEVRMRLRDAEALCSALRCRLSAAAIRRAVELSGGRSTVLSGLCVAADLLGPAPVQQALERATNLTELLTRVARAWLVMSDATELQALALALQVGYVQYALLEAALRTPTLPAGPWLQPLEGGWWRVQPVWQAALQSGLRNRVLPERAALQRTAAYLADQGAIEQALPLYFALDERRAAAETINRALEAFVSMGHWETLEEWLSQLSTQTLEEWPWLVYAGGELAAAQGQLDAAQHAFGLALRLFETHRHPAGSCQSLLAQSTLATWRGDPARAEAHALAARTMAEAAGLAWYHGWAAWQLGCLAAAADDLEAALAYFGQAQDVAATLNEPLMVELPRQAALLIMHQRDLRSELDYHRTAYAAAERAEQAVAEQLHQLLAAPQQEVDQLLAAHGWARLPLMLKLLAPPARGEPAAITANGGLWKRLLSLFGLSRHQPAPLPAARIELRLAAESAVVAAAAVPMEPLLRTFDLPIPQPSVEEFAREVGAPEPVRTTVPAAEAATTVPFSADTAGELEVTMLGAFRVALNGRAVETWPSQRGRAVLKYLLSQRQRPVPREILMDMFWPEATPESARNSLNVAVYGLRQAFRAVSEMPVVLFENGVYALNPELTVQIDAERFERRMQAARQCETSGRVQMAMAEYAAAIELYDGDFLAEDPYESWPVLMRERLRTQYLEALERLSQLHYAQGQYTECVTLCQAILTVDSCREDAHCRLMRAYARQGQYLIALRQYQACVDILRSELGVEPAETTLALYERIRRREPV